MHFVGERSTGGLLSTLEGIKVSSAIVTISDSTASSERVASYFSHSVSQNTKVDASRLRNRGCNYACTRAGLASHACASDLT